MLNPTTKKSKVAANDANEGFDEKAPCAFSITYNNIFVYCLFTKLLHPVTFINIYGNTKHFFGEWLTTI